MYANCLHLCRQWKTRTGQWDGKTQREEGTETMSTFLNVLFKNTLSWCCYSAQYQPQSARYPPTFVGELKLKLFSTKCVHNYSYSAREISLCLPHVALEELWHMWKKNPTPMMSQWCHQVCLSFSYKSHNWRQGGWKKMEFNRQRTKDALAVHYGKCRTQQLLALCPGSGLKCQNMSVSGALI